MIHVPKAVFQYHCKLKSKEKLEACRRKARNFEREFENEKQNSKRKWRLVKYGLNEKAVVKHEVETVNVLQVMESGVVEILDGMVGHHAQTISCPMAAW